MLPIMNPDTVNFTRRPLWRRWSWLGATIVLLTLLMSAQVKAEYPSPPHKGLSMSTFWISPDGQRVVFMTDQNVNGSYELYSAPTDGSSPAVPLGRLLPSGLAPEYYFIISLAFSPDSSRLVFLARQEADSTYELPWVYELYSVPVAGGDVVKLNHIQERYAGVGAFQISPDSQRVVYQAQQQEYGVSELYSELLSGGEVIKLNAPLSGSGNVNKFEISPDGSRVVYRVDGVDEPDELYSTLSTGDPAPVKISGIATHNSQIVNFHISPNSRRVVYQADQDTLERNELYSTPIAGGTVPVKLNSLLVDEAEVKDPRNTDGILRDTFQISPDSSRVIYQVDQGFNKAKELYSVPLGGGIAVKLNSPLNGNIFNFQISPDSRKVIYGESDQEYEPAEYDLFSASLDGAEVVRLDGPLVSTNSYQISADSSRVVYLAKTVKEGMPELYTAPLIGGKVVKLNGPLASGSSIGTFQIIPDSSGVVYKVHDGEPYQETMYTIPFGIGTTPVKLNRVILSEGYSGQFQLSPDSRRVVYWSTLNLPDVPQLYSLSLTDKTEPVNLSGPLFRYGDVVEFQITPDGRQVVYLVEQGWLGYALYSVPLSGGKAIKLGEVSHKRDGGTFQISPDSRRVLYYTQQTGHNSQHGLYSVPIGGGTTPVKLNGPLVKDGVVAEFRISADSSRVVYRAAQETEGVYELYSVPLSGGEVVKLNEPPDGGFGVFEFKISPDSRRVVYHSDQDADNVDKLYSVPLAGGAAPIQLNGQLDREDLKSDISTFVLSPDSSRVLWQVRRQGANQAVENLLYSVPLDGGQPVQLNDLPLTDRLIEGFRNFDNSGLVYMTTEGELYNASWDDSSASVKLNGPLDSNNSITSFEISPDGHWVIYRLTTGGELYSVSSKGGAAPVKLNGPLAKDDRVDNFYVSPNSSHLIYWVNQEAAGTQELYSVPLGGGEVVKLEVGPVQKGSIWQTDLTNSRVVYQCCAVNRAALHIELYSISIADNAAPLKLNEPLLSGSYVSSFRISPDGSSVVYLADQDLPGVKELFIVPSAGGAAPVKLNGSLLLDEP